MIKVLVVYDLHTYPYYTGHTIMIEVRHLGQIEDEFEKQMNIRERRREFTNSPQPTVWRLRSCILEDKKPMLRLIEN